ncbi:VPS45 Vacuolar protein sorting-associated protein 45 [Candida maltosa Xu316]
MCYTQSELLTNNIVLIELIENTHQLASMKHLDCIIYIKPSQESIRNVCSELHNPHYGKYQLYLNNCINKTQLELISEADEYEVITRVMELFQDYSIVTNNLFLVDVPLSTNPVVQESEKLISLLLALKKTPLIKYESNSIDLKRLSSEVLYQINSNSNNNLFDDLNRNADSPPLLLLLDRKNDPITPLVTPWTYQSMIHEFLGIDKNVVQVLSNDGTSSIVLSPETDSFYRESMYLNYGDLTEKFQRYVEKYKSETKQSSIDNLKSSNLSELKKVLTKYPEFKKFSTNVMTHLNLISEIDKQISQQHLWDVGELQQTIAGGLDNQQNIRTRVSEVLDSKKVSTINKIKLVLLYVYRFDNTRDDVSLFLAKLNNPETTSPLPTPSQVELIRNFRSGGGTIVTKTHQPQGLTDLFANKKIDINKLFNRGNASENVYLSYTPRLSEILSSVIHPTTQQNTYGLSSLVPDKVKQQYGAGVIDEPVQDIIIYIKGGVTYEESRLIHELSQATKGINLIVGGDEILNSKKYLSKYE